MKGGLKGLIDMCKMSWRMLRIQGFGGMMGYSKGLVSGIFGRGRTAVTRLAEAVSNGDESALAKLFHSAADCIVMLPEGRMLSPRQLLDEGAKLTVTQITAAGWHVSCGFELDGTTRLAATALHDQVARPLGRPGKVVQTERIGREQTVVARMPMRRVTMIAGRVEHRHGMRHAIELGRIGHPSRRLTPDHLAGLTLTISHRPGGAGSIETELVTQAHRHRAFFGVTKKQLGVRRRNSNDDVDGTNSGLKGSKVSKVKKETMESKEFKALKVLMFYPPIQKVHYLQKNGYYILLQVKE